MYTYGILKEALMGKAGDKNKAYTPNSVRCIVISPQFIFIGRHVGADTLTYLNQGEVLDDLGYNGSTGSLNSILKSKQLSCLEEIYVDSSLKEYQGFLNLEAYIDTLVNTKSRLRAYGYCSNVNPEELKKSYEDVKMFRIVDYMYGEDPKRTSQVQVTFVDNAYWYTKYNLRPDKYAPDGDGKPLSIYFKTVQKEIQERDAKKIEELKAQGINGAAEVMFMLDYSRRVQVAMLYTLYYATTANTNPISKWVNSVAKTTISSMQLYDVGLENLKSKLMELKKSPAYLKMYARFNFSKGSKEDFDLDVMQKHIESGDGFIQVKQSYYKAIINSVSGMDNYVKLALMASLERLGLYQQGVGISETLKLVNEEATSVEVYNSILMDMAGYNNTSLLATTERRD